MNSMFQTTSIELKLSHTQLNSFSTVQDFDKEFSSFVNDTLLVKPYEDFSDTFLHKMVGRVLMTDSTHVKANANKHHSMGFAIAVCADSQNVTEQTLITAAVQNMKKMAVHLDRLEKRG